MENNLADEWILFDYCRWDVEGTNMRLVQINICDNGSTGKIMLDIFDSLGKDVEKVAYVSRKYTDREFVKRMHTRMQYRIHKFLSMYLALDEFGSYFTTKKVIKELEKNKPDILHLHNIHNHTINYRLLFGYIKKNNIKTVWTLHDCWAFTGGCFHFEYNGCDKWRGGCGNCKFLESTATRIPINCTSKYYEIKKKAFTGVKNMIIATPSKWLKNLVKQSFLKDYRVEVVNNGVNLSNFNYVEEHSFDNVIDRNKKIILGVASPFGEKKGFNDFLKLAGKIGDDYRIVLVGLRNNQIDSLPGNIVGIERTDNQRQLAGLYSMAYAFVNLTYEDTFSMVNLEALSCGTPVICYDTGGAVEMLNDKNSVIVKQGDLNGIVNALGRIDDLKRNAKDFTQQIKSEFSCDKMASQYLRLYEELTDTEENA